MLLEFALIILVALLFYYLFIRIKLPGLLGLVTTGLIIGPSFLDWASDPVLALLKEFKTVALIVILIRAGLGINRATLNTIGGPAIRLSFIPGIIEGTTILFLSHFLLNLTLIEGGMLGFILAAVSPAVVVPSMLELKDAGWGKQKEVPTLVLAGASVDDVFAITIFGVFVGLATGESLNLTHVLVSVPLGIFVGAAIGVGIGFGLVWFFKRYHIRDTKKVIIFTMIAVLFYEFTEVDAVKNLIPIAGLLGIMVIGFVILEKYDILARRLAAKFGKVWVLAEILLFVYIGTQVDLNQISVEVLGIGVLMLFLGLLARSLGVWLSLLKCHLNTKEKIFCTIAYWPKATVQAAIGAVPLSLFYDGKMTSMTEATGQTILAIAVLSIMIAAPLGAIGIQWSGPKLLSKP